MGYVETALENGRSVFPVERRFERAGKQTVCMPARFTLEKTCRAAEKKITSRLICGVLAQLVERLVRNEKVRGSNPLGSSCPAV